MADRRLRGLVAALAIGATVPAAVAAAPESLLPPGFGKPPPPPARAPTPVPPKPATTPRATPPPSPAAPRTPRFAPAPVPPPRPSASPPPPAAQPSTDPGGDPPTVVAAPPVVAPDLGAAADRIVVFQRPSGVVGVLGPDEGGVAFDGFGTTDGRFLVALLDATRAPVTSRWQQIVARRALLSRVPTPPTCARPIGWAREPPSWCGLARRTGRACSSAPLIPTG